MVIDRSGAPLGTLPGSRVANAAAILGRNGFEVLMASEAAADAVGDIAVSALAQAGVDLTSVDRYTEGRTPLNIYVADAGDLTRYEQYPAECFDIIWPRINENDVVLFGGFYAIDGRMHARMLRLLQHAVERKAVLIYLPGFLPQLEPRITRVMPRILENLEMANMVIARTGDLSLIFGVSNAADGYREHIDFYCRSLVAIEPDRGVMTYYSGKDADSVPLPDSMGASMLWNAGVAAGAAAAVIEGACSPSDFEAPDAAMRHTILDTAATCAAKAVEATRFPALGF